MLVYQTEMTKSIEIFCHGMRSAPVPPAYVTQNPRVTRGSGESGLSPSPDLSESLLISDRNACFKRCLTSATPCFMNEILLFQWFKCLLCCWIRAYARIWGYFFVL
jgi:hypothetical protein